MRTNNKLKEKTIAELPPESARLAVLISGNGSNLQALIDAIRLRMLNAQIVVVVSNKKDAFGLQRAEKAGIPTRYHPLKPYKDAEKSRAEYDADLAKLLKEFKPTYVVLAGWMHILSSEFLKFFPYRVVNLHPALPGTFPGINAVERAFEAFQRKEIKKTGVMVHLVPDEAVDAGPVLESEAVPIYSTDTLDTLIQRVHTTEHRLLITALRRLIDGDE